MSFRNDFFDKSPMQKQEQLRKMSYEELRKIRYLDLSTRLLWHALHPEETEHFARLHGRARDTVEQIRRDDPKLLGIVYGKGSKYLGEVQRIIKEAEPIEYQFRAYIWSLPMYHKNVFAHLRKRLTGEELWVTDREKIYLQDWCDGMVKPMDSYGHPKRIDGYDRRIKPKDTDKVDIL
jgi:hypothetical protein